MNTLNPVSNQSGAVHNALMTLRSLLPGWLTRLLIKVKQAMHSSPMTDAIRELQRRGIRLGSVNALEVFAKEGAWHTLDYAEHVRSLDAWDIDPECETALKRNIPKANVKITDSFREIRCTPKKYGLVVVDNSMSIYGDTEKHCEHFDLFPILFRVMEDEAVLIVNIILPKVTAEFKKRYPYLFNEQQMQARGAFYHTDNPATLSVKDMVNTYMDHARQCGFSVPWHFVVTRVGPLRYLVLKLSCTRHSV